jgi:zinc protease
MSNYVAMIGFYGLPIDYLDTFTDKVNSVTTVDIRKAFHSHLQLDHFQTVLVGGRSQSHGN